MSSIHPTAMEGHDSDFHFQPSRRQGHSRRNEDRVLSALAEKGHYYRAVIDAFSEAIVTLSPEGLIQNWNLRAEQMFGYSEDEVKDRSIGFLTVPEHLGLGGDSRETGRAIHQSDMWETLKQRKDGTVLDVSITLSPVYGRASDFVGSVLFIRDISALLRARADGERRDLALQEEALTDSLTGIANRRQLDRRLRSESSRNDRQGGNLTLILADIDNLKSINDDYGHAVGDESLRAFAGAMNAHIRAGDLLARMGGDEFIVVMPGSGDVEAAVCVQRIRAALETLVVPSLPRQLSASFGIAVHCPGDSIAIQLQRADRAMYQAKRAGHP